METSIHTLCFVRSLYCIFPQYESKYFSLKKSLHAKALYVVTTPLCSAPRPSPSDEPAAYDACWKLPDTPHACRRHPGWLRLGLHRLTQSPRVKSGADKTRAERMEAECLCYRARGLDLRCLHAHDRRQIGMGHLKNSAGVVHYDL